MSTEPQLPDAGGFTPARPEFSAASDILLPPPDLPASGDNPLSPPDLPAAPARRSFLPWLVVGLLVCVIGCGLVMVGSIGYTAYNETAKVLNTTATAQAVQVATTQAASITLATRAGWPALFEDRFDSNLNRWTVGTSTSEFGTITWTVNSAALQVDMLATQDTFARNEPTRLAPVADGFLSMSARLAGGTAKSNYGLVFRDDGRSRYYFTLVDDQAVHLVLDDQGNWKQLWQGASAAIKPGQANRLAVDLAGPHMLLYVNDQFIAAVDDTTSPSGRVGVGIGAVNDRAAFEFTDFTLRVSPEAQSAQAATATARAGIPLATATAAAARVAATRQAAQAAAGAGAQWPVVISDTFDSNANNWPVTDLKGAGSSLKRSIADGIYRWEAQTTKGSIWNYRPNMLPVADAYFAVDAHRLSGAESAEYGLIFRNDGDNYYLFDAFDSGEYNVSVWNKGEWSFLILDTFSAAIRPGETNRLAVSANGTHFVFYINGQYVADLDDDALSTGRAGLSLDVHEGDAAIVVFDNFEVRGPLTAQAQAAQATATAQVAATTAVVQAAQARAAAAAQWPLAFAETFADNTHDWPLDDSSASYGPMRATLGGGRYRWEAKALKDVIWWEMPQMQEFGDFTLLAETTVLTVPTGAQSGVVFRKSGENYYAFQLRGDSTYRLILHADGQTTTLISRSGSTAIRPGALNRILVLGQGSHFTFFVNDAYVTEFDDKRLPRGIAGLAISLIGGDEAVFEYDRFDVRTP